MTQVSVRVFKGTQNTPLTTQEDKLTILPPLYKMGWKDESKHITTTLDKLHSMEEIALVIPTKNNPLLIIDYDIQEDFDTALLLNNALPKEEQCQYIVTSKRKGGHFYYLPTEGVNQLHTDKSVKVDILGNGNNAIAPTLGDTSKSVTALSYTLTEIHPLMLHYLNSLIMSQANPKDRRIYLTAQDGHSDDNFQMVEDFILSRLETQKFADYYNIPDIIPPGESWAILQKLTYRLLSDETLEHSKVLQALGKYDPDHRQDHSALAPAQENKFNKMKKEYSLTLQHSDLKTPLTVYLDRFSGDHVLQYSKEDGEPIVLKFSTEAKLKTLVEKMTQVKKARINWHLIRDIDLISSYQVKGGFNYESKEFNTSYHNTFLKAFKGIKPDGYIRPTPFLDMLKLMWEDEYDYLLGHAKYRYRTFEHTPVIHHIVGVEGSGKNVSEFILNRGFTEESQEVDYQLFVDKHSIHQTLPNTVLGEVGDWNKIEQEGSLAKIKTMTGNGGKVVVRGMQQEAKTIPTINKIWVLGNNWIKLHNNPLTQRRVHATYMPNPLTIDFGGPYTPEEIEHFLGHENLVHFYYWLGNEYENNITKSEYMSAFSRQKSTSYNTYLEAVEGKSDRIIRLLADQTYEGLLRALALVDRNIEDITLKYNQQSLMVVSINSLKLAFIQINGATYINRALVDINAQRESSKKLAFDKSPEKFITIYDAPTPIEKQQEELNMQGA